ncbi:MAG TPA: PadR family transcriptional regulator [Gemmatimonadaceae bacterium]|nr:PadR family transcriptional regulator [Gemmatimonadaceae bacterium]
MPIESSDLLQGTLQVLILKALLAESAHGYGIARWIEKTTDDALRVEEGSLYPALRRLEDKRYVSSDWGLSENNRRARYYRLTTAGRAYLRNEAAAWHRFSRAMTRVMRAAPALS